MNIQKSNYHFERETFKMIETTSPLVWCQVNTSSSLAYVSSNNFTAATLCYISPPVPEVQHVTEEGRKGGEEDINYRNDTHCMNIITATVLILESTRLYATSRP